MSEKAAILQNDDHVETGSAQLKSLQHTVSDILHSHDTKISEDKNDKVVDGNKDDIDDSDNDPNFIKFSKTVEEDFTELKGDKYKKAFFGLVNDLLDVTEILICAKTKIRPKLRHIRDLDIETGGLEAEKKNNHDKDIWDDRSEEVDEMGTARRNNFNSTNIRSFIARKKQQLRLLKKIRNIPEAKLSKSDRVLLKENRKLSFSERMSLREDRTNDFARGSTKHTR